MDKKYSESDLVKKCHEEYANGMKAAFQLVIDKIEGNQSTSSVYGPADELYKKVLALIGSLEKN